MTNEFTLIAVDPSVWVALSPWATLVAAELAAILGALVAVCWGMHKRGF